MFLHGRVHEVNMSAIFSQLVQQTSGSFRGKANFTTTGKLYETEKKLHASKEKPVLWKVQPL